MFYLLSSNRSIVMPFVVVISFLCATTPAFAMKRARQDDEGKTTSVKRSKVVDDETNVVDDVPNDIWNLIFENFSEEDHFLINRHVCKTWNNLMRRPPIFTKIIFTSIESERVLHLISESRNFKKILSLDANPAVEINDIAYLAPHLEIESDNESIINNILASLNSKVITTISVKRKLSSISHTDESPFAVDISTLKNVENLRELAIDDYIQLKPLHFVCSSLKELTIKDARNLGLEEIKQFKDLNILLLQQVPIDSTILETISNNNPQLETLDICASNAVRLSDFDEVKLPNLKKLCLSGNFSEQDRDETHEQFPLLEDLEIQEDVIVNRDPVRKKIKF